ncbi:MAG: hypothetical protein ACI4OR_00725 [Alphaproteobacteria bacterium]
MENSITLNSFEKGVVAGIIVSELIGFKKYLVNNFDMSKEGYQTAIKIAESVISMLSQQPFENKSKEKIKFLIDVYTEARIHQNPYDKERLENIAFLMKSTLDWMATQK